MLLMIQSHSINIYWAPRENLAVKIKEGEKCYNHIDSSLLLTDTVYLKGIDSSVYVIPCLSPLFGLLILDKKDQYIVNSFIYT